MRPCQSSRESATQSDRQVLDSSLSACRLSTLECASQWHSNMPVGLVLVTDGTRMHKGIWNRPRQRTVMRIWCRSMVPIGRRMRCRIPLRRPGRHKCRSRWCSRRRVGTGKSQPEKGEAVQARLAELQRLLSLRRKVRHTRSGYQPSDLVSLKPHLVDRC
jgi:hypothetical protein